MKKVVKMSGQESPSQSAEPILPKKNGLTGMRGFTIVWAGQMLSLLGTNMTGFALAIWIYEVTAESFRATAFSLVAFFAFAP